MWTIKIVKVNMAGDLHGLLGNTGMMAKVPKAKLLT